MTVNTVNPPPAQVALSEATKLKNKLRELANKAGETAYQRIGLAAQLMLDKAWIANEFPNGEDSEGRATGGPHAALATIEDEFFGDLCGSVSLARLLKMHEVVPESEWKRHRYNLQRVAAAYQERLSAQTTPREPARRATNEQVAQLEEDVAHWKSLDQRHEKEAKSAASEVQRLRAELAEKDRQIAVLMGRVEELEKIVERFGIRQMA